jgi:hypothetical protein
LMSFFLGRQKPSLRSGYYDSGTSPTRRDRRHVRELQARDCKVTHEPAAN